MGGNPTKNLTFILCGLLILSLSISSTSFSAQTISKTIIVDQEGTGDYTTITDAIAGSNNGDTIIVHQGVYEENNIVIDKTIELLGENSSSTIIQGDETKTILIIQANEVIVNGFTITKGGDWGGENIALNSNNVTISGNIIEMGNGTGIRILNSSGSAIKKNTFNSNQEGIMCYNCINLHILNNQIFDSLAGIYLYNSHNVVIEKNTVKSCSKGIYLEESNENTIQRNHLFSNEQGTFLSYSSNNILTENNYISNVEQAKFTTWLSPTGLQLSSWDSNYWDNSLAILPKCIPGILFIRTYNPIGIFLPWVAIDWNPALERYEINL
mgnify:CR=1 FL=1